MEEFTARSGRHWNYDPDSPLGRPGGFGAVFAGFGDNGEPCAVKILSTTITDLPERLRQREIEIAKKLQENSAQYLIRIFDIGQTNDRLALVMQRAEESLLAAHKRGLTKQEMLSALSDISNGLRELHRIGIIHRDLKPENILRHEGKWKLGDFGIAHDTEVGTQTYTFAGWVGSWAYVAPELFEARSPTPSSDLYALGCLAYELVAGAPPFGGPTWEDYRAQHAQSLPTLPHDVPPTLARLIIRLLQKKAGERPQDARDVVERLARISDNLTSLQSDIAKASAEFAQRQASNAASVAAQGYRETLQVQEWNGVIAEFKAICEEGLEIIQGPMPDVILNIAATTGLDDMKLTLEGEDVWLQLTVWHISSIKWNLNPGDPMIAAGEVLARNRESLNWAKRNANIQGDYPVRLANVAVELNGDRITWIAYYFSCSDLQRYYGFGPKEREHGLQYRYFFDYRKTPGFEKKFGIQLRKEVFTEEVLAQFLRQAIALPSDAYSKTEVVGLTSR
jgi:serine/threonine protein kinase